MDEPTPYDDFLAAVDQLRGENPTVQVTAHTANVATTGWPPADNTDTSTDQQ
ncbi:hypothetical protein [Micromonospora sp. NPDC050276]|uniref:hypothetical protein n=1 Tax=Micromonospora sp. NPDC050276 TaxID=3364278 RepID=UPI003791BA99